jgi:hypothetical protein
MLFHNRFGIMSIARADTSSGISPKSKISFLLRLFRHGQSQGSDSGEINGMLHPAATYLAVKLEQERHGVE